MLRLFHHFYIEDIDRAWVEHLTNMEHLRDGIGLRGYGQRDPKQEYKKEGYDLFLSMIAKVSSNVLVKCFEFKPRSRQDLEQLEAEAAERRKRQMKNAKARHPGAQPAPPPAVEKDQPCPCGSGKPFRQCHGAPADDEVQARA